MSEAIYNWKRFWCSREGTISLADDGYLVDPESALGFFNLDLRPIELLLEVPCLILLGEPGMGKSTVFRALRDSWRPADGPSGEAPFCLNLAAYSSEDRLVDDLFRSGPIQEWKRGRDRLEVSLDGLDECRLRIETVSSLLLEELRRLPTERLALRIFCRTAGWTDLLESGLRALWGREAMSVYELAPLRRADVEEAARVETLESGMDPLRSDRSQRSSL